MANHLLEFLNSNNTLYKLQFGFRKHFSISHAIVSLVEKINKAISSDKYMIGVFLDFRKAYDTVNHSILIKKLYKCGARGHTLNWFKSYLTDRQQFVSVNNNDSSKKCITCEIPQVSVLGGKRRLITFNNQIKPARQYTQKLLLPVFTGFYYFLLFSYTKTVQSILYVS